MGVKLGLSSQGKNTDSGCEIWGVHGDEDAYRGLLGCDTV
jgi:hypothetical protein